MAGSHQKIHKSLDRPCPDCEEKELMLISEIVEMDDGVKFVNKKIICAVCGYEEPFHVSKKKKREELVCRGKEVARKKRYSRKSMVWSR